MQKTKKWLPHFGSAWPRWAANRKQTPKKVLIKATEDRKFVDFFEEEKTWLSYHCVGNNLQKMVLNF